MAGLGVLEVNDATFDQEVLQERQGLSWWILGVWCGPARRSVPAVDSSGGGL